jgi:hypothetical protein
MPGTLLYAAVFDPKKGVGITLIYKDATGVPWGKKVHIERFITNRKAPGARVEPVNGRPDPPA